MRQALAKIGEVSEMLGLTRRAIRHYEQRGLVETVRGPSGVRLFDDAARRRLEWIAKLRIVCIGLGGDRRSPLQLTIKKREERAERRRANVQEIEAAADLMRAALGGSTTPMEAGAR